MQILKKKMQTNYEVLKVPEYLFSKFGGTYSVDIVVSGLGHLNLHQQLEIIMSFASLVSGKSFI